MEALRRKVDGSGEYGFTFPSTPLKDRDSNREFEFEFDSLTLTSPSSDMNKNSPADHFFYNGKLLPHRFPCRTSSTMFLIGNANSRLVPSRTSSVSSKESYSPSSLVSSRSNSVSSSRSSSSCSARTSYSSDGSERRLVYHNKKLGSTLRTRSTRETRSTGPHCSKDVLAQVYGSQRWQFIMPMMPVLSRETSSRRKKGEEMIIKEETSKPKRRGLCRRVIESFFSTCRQCHAMED